MSDTHNTRVQPETPAVRTGPSTELSPSTTKPLSNTSLLTSFCQSTDLTPHLLVAQSCMGASHPQALGIPTLLSRRFPCIYLAPWQSITLGCDH